jgi:transposase
MSRAKEAPDGFVCPYRGRCPELEGLSTHWIFSEYQRSSIREHQHRLIREDMRREISALEQSNRELKEQNDQLIAENKVLHQRRFKARAEKGKKKVQKPKPEAGPQDKKTRPRGAPGGHPAWSRKEPSRIDREIRIEAPCVCPHCQSETDISNASHTSYVQEDIVLKPRIVVSRYTCDTAYCPECRRQVANKVEGELAFSPIGPNAKAAALYLRHEIKMPYRKVTRLMRDLFGFDFTHSSILGFEQRARKNADPLYENLILKMRRANVVHADETYWREDGENKIVWYAGNEDVAVFHIDAHRSSETALRLLGPVINGLLVTDAYAAYNVIKAEGRQSCLAHLLRKSKEIRKILETMKQPDQASLRFCNKLIRLFKDACAVNIPKAKKARKELEADFRRTLDAICKKQLSYKKAETLRKRLLPCAREYHEVFAFMLFDGPPTNNHAERALRPLVIFRKVCMGSRSDAGSKNISVFSSLTETAKLQSGSPLEMFQTLLSGTSAQAHDIIFNN